MLDNKIEKIIKEKIIKKEKITDAISNDVYCINDKYIIRYKTKGDIFYHPRIEKKIDNITKNYGINADTIYFDDEGNRISKRVLDFRYIDTNSREDIEKCASTIRLLHSIDIKICHNFSPFSQISFYKKQNISLYMKEQKIIKEVKSFPLDIVVCHNDLVRGNMLFTKKKMYLIDYEYSGLNDRYFDLASFVSENEIDNKKIITFFLNSYFKNFSYSQEKFIAYLNLVNLLWLYWAEYKFNLSGNLVFKEIAKNKLEQLKKWDNISHL